MGLFSKKKKIDLDQVFVDKYKEINKVVSQANNELDFEIKLSLLKLADEKYQDLLKLIDDGANYERDHFEKLQASVKKQISDVEGVVNEN